METWVYSNEDLRKLVSQVGLDQLLDDVVEALERTLRSNVAERYTVPRRDGFSYSTPSNGLLEWMPAMEQAGDVTVKLVGYHPENPGRRSLPTIVSTALTFSTETGHLLAILDATFATALRTAAASVVASRVLARTDASVLGLIGCGAQAIAHLHALSRSFPIEEALIHDCDETALETFASRASDVGRGHVRIRHATPGEIVRASEILCTSTSVEPGAGPVFEDDESAVGLHVNAVGSDFPGKFELPRRTLQRALVCPDFREQAVLEGECQFVDPETIGPDLTELVQMADEYTRYRDRLTVFDSTGWALEDHVAVQVLIVHAKRLGLGTQSAIEMIAEDPRNPYAPFVVGNSEVGQAVRRIRSNG